MPNKPKSTFFLLVQPKNKAAYIQPGKYATLNDAKHSAYGYAMSGEVLFTVYEMFLASGSYPSSVWSLRRTLIESAYGNAFREHPWKPTKGREWDED